MCKLGTTIKQFFVKDWTLSEKVLFSAAVTFAGILVGFLLAPVKNGFKFNMALASYNASGNACDSGNANKDNKGQIKEGKDKKNHKKENKAK